MLITCLVGIETYNPHIWYIDKFLHNIADSRYTVSSAHRTIARISKINNNTHTLRTAQVNSNTIQTETGTTRNRLLWHHTRYENFHLIQSSIAVHTLVDCANISAVLLAWQKRLFATVWERDLSVKLYQRLYISTETQKILLPLEIEHWIDLLNVNKACTQPASFLKPTAVYHFASRSETAQEARTQFRYKH